MPTIVDTIHRLLPRGTRLVKNRVPEWKKCPVWPPDAFAVAATLVSLSACYARFRVGGDDPEQYPDEMAGAGEEWRESWKHVLTTLNMPDAAPLAAQNCWDALMKHGSANVSLELEVSSEVAWWDPAMRLLAMADEASVGVGFSIESDDIVSSSFIQELVLFARSGRFTKKSERAQYLPDRSICRMVPVSEACVQPKARTAQVGCTLRSLSHHLALLPPTGEAGAEWWIAPPSADSQFNLLIVPLPYRIPSGSFKPAPKDKRTGNYFSVDPGCWLPDPALRATEVATFLVKLVKAAEERGGNVHGVVLPELALDIATAKEVARTLHQACPSHLELFVSGVLDGKNNAAYTAVFTNRERQPVFEWTQRKHHRWRLDSGQIMRYGLSHVLDPGKVWWENADLQERVVKSLVLRHGASLNVLVCEDLARLDPAQVFLRALGPSLVVALLLDGAQVAPRWPGQCASVLAEDPGSSVLTLTSLGMVRRGAGGKPASNWQIALWKESGKKAEELRLSNDAHAVLATLFFTDGEQSTLDRRSDGGTTVRASLAQYRQVTHPDPPKWVHWPR